MLESASGPLSPAARGGRRGFLRTAETTEQRGPVVVAEARLGQEMKFVPEATAGAEALTTGQFVHSQHKAVGEARA